MSMKRADFKTLLNDLKISLRFAARNVISFILGMIGVLVVSGLLLGVIMLVTFPVLIFGVGLQRIAEFFTALGVGLEAMEGTAILGVLMMIVAPILAPFLVAIGALFGMGREIVESAGTSASGVFEWYKRKFFSLAGAGVLQFIIIILPVALLVMTPIPTPLATPNTAVLSISSALGTLYFLVVGGMLSMTFPAVIDGHGPFDAIRVSVSMSIDYFDRVFSVWLSHIGLPVVLLLPIGGASFTAIWMSISPVSILAGIYGIAAFILVVFLIIPAIVIGISRVYLILSGEERESREDEHPNINLVGDV
ncbi:MAG: hypothetical protein GF309_16200 [Candidatus Lokiarchaeota archaeon]|nr:hypothetical protein [Candidatus Lokiarchaeota archaeon]